MKIALKGGQVVAILAAWLLLGGSGVGLLTGCDHDHGQTTSAARPQMYTCGMHPQILQDHPGNCPICGMKLTPVRRPADSFAAGTASGSASIAIDPLTIQNMGLRTAEVTRGTLRRTIRTVGTIQYNEAALADVTTKFRGWVEKLYVDTTGQQVHQGDPLFEIYSPELYSAQREYLLVLEQGTNVPGQADLKASARTKLKFFDISDGQISELERARQPRKTLGVHAPQDGFVVDKAVVQGQMVDPGMKMYRLADLGLVWVQAQIYEQDLALVKLGQEATVTLAYLPDREFRGRVTYLYPNVDEKTRTAMVRMEFHNPGYLLKPGMFATVRLVCEVEPTAVLVPDMAVLRSGEKNTVFVALEGGRFEPREVRLGALAEDDCYQVLAGLKEGERIVTSGQFLLDSESQLREAVQKMAGPAVTAGGAAAGSQRIALANATAPAGLGAVKYICPMPEHVSIEYDHPGKCPLCGMALVPVNSAALSRMPPGGKLLYYTCPMPEHAEVHEPKPGKCPKCGMTLIPVLERPKLEPTTATPATAITPARLFTCPMASHADVVSDQPGKCPKCEMDLVPVETVAHGKVAEENWRKAHRAAELSAPEPHN